MTTNPHTFSRWMANTLWEVPTGNHGSCIHGKKYTVQDDEYNYHDPLQARLIKVIVRYPAPTASVLNLGMSIYRFLIENQEISRKSHIFRHAQKEEWKWARYLQSPLQFFRSHIKLKFAVKFIWKKMKFYAELRYLKFLVLGIQLGLK